MNDSEIKGWILYDDSCGFCRKWVPFWEETLRKRGLATAPLQSEWVAGALGLPTDQLLTDIRLWLTSGQQTRGADVYRYVMRRIWWTYPAYLLSIAPLFRSAFDLCYRAFASHRHQLSGACRLK
jgi:predicted DCC family thiol-disulfide oxidoreductase YuxK